MQWTDRLKDALQQRKKIVFEPSQIRYSLYRPFVKEFLYFDHLLNQRRYQQHTILPASATESENRLICIPSAGGRAKYWCFCTNLIPNLTLTSIDGTQCFPFYTYDEDGTNRRENITDWALAQFREHYKDDSIGKWDIFHYIYAVLHHPVYRERYADNLKRELPRIPFATPLIPPHPPLIKGGIRGDLGWEIGGASGHASFSLCRLSQPKV